MADLSLKIKADFDEATKAFRALADNSDYAEAALDKFTKSMKLDHAERFIDGQERMGAALTATKGQLAAAEAQKAAYGREIERLIKNGFDPEDEAVQKLKKEYDALGKQIDISNEKKKATEAAAKVATGALLALGAAVTAAAGVALKAAADMEDQIASPVPMMGGSTKAAEDLFKTIRQEAITTPFEIDNITASVRSLMPAFQGSSNEAVKAFRMIGDTAQGNSQKLESITRAYTNAMLSDKVQMKELNTIAGAGVPIFTEMAESMGITVEQLRDMSSKGQLTADDLTGAFQKMTSEGGLFYNGMESASDTLNMRMLGLKESLGIVASEIGMKLLPEAKNIVGAAGDAVEGFALWIQEGDNLEKMLRTLTTTAIAAAAGLTAFVIVNNLTNVSKVNEMKKAISGLMKAFTGPAGIAGIAIAALAAGVGALVALNASQAKQGEKIAENLVNQKTKADQLLSAYGGLNPAKKLDEATTKELIKLYPELSDVIKENESSVKDAADAIEGLNEKKAKDASQKFIDQLLKQSKIIDEARKTIEEYKGTSSEMFATKLMEDNIKDAEKKLERAKKNANDILSTIGLEVDISNNFEFIKTAERNIKELTDTRIKEEERARKTIAQILAEVPLTEKQLLNERINQTMSFLNNRADLEKTEGEARVSSIQAEASRALNIEGLKEEERRAIIAASNELIAQIHKKATDEYYKTEDGKNEKLAETLKGRVGLFKNALAEEDITEAQAQKDRIASAEQFFTARAEAESEEKDRRIEFLRQQAEEMKAVYQEDAAARVAIERAVQNTIFKLQDEAKKREVALLEIRLGAMMDFTGGMGQLFGELGKKNKAAAMAAKGISAVEAGINSYLAFTKALASVPYPFNMVAAAGTLASGLAQQIKIQNTPITAETGGNFIVPDLSPRVDNIGLRVQGGEEINVTPRGMVGREDGNIHIKVNINDKELFNIINDGFKSGEIYMHRNL